MELLEYWKGERLKFYENIGIPRAKLHVKNVADEERAFYSKGTYDIEYEFPFGVQELEGVAYRTDYDYRSIKTRAGNRSNTSMRKPNRNLFRTWSNQVPGSIELCWP